MKKETALLANTQAPLFARVLLALALAFSLSLPLAACGTAGSSGAASSAVTVTPEEAALSIADIPEYSGTLTFDVNNGVPGFTESDLKKSTFKDFSELDFEGRCGTAFALLGPETVSDEERGDISKIHPSGWEQARYDFIDGETLWTRSHLIAHQLSGENANERNLITGTRTFNAQGMLYYEEIVGDYIRDTGNHVLYRVTPLFAANDLVARGVQMEAESVEDGGESVLFNVFVYNVEPGVGIDYASGESWEDSAVPEAQVIGVNTHTAAGAQTQAEELTGSSSTSASGDEVQEYVLNTGGLKFHKPDCPSVDDMAEHNRKNYTGTRTELIMKGYKPCGTCQP